MTTRRIIFILFFTALLVFGLATTAYGQETTEEATQAAPDTTTAEETTVTTTTAPRTVSAEDLIELEGATTAVSNAQAVVQHILNRIITEYQINVQEEVLNIKTGEITPRATTTQ